MKKFLPLLLVAILAGCGGSARAKVFSGETIYVRNLAPQYISDKTILRDIPSWEEAANESFSRYWGTPKIRIVLGKAPAGGIQATFKNQGPIQGALAFHEVARGTPAIVVYAGVDDFYGYSNSVSFTHELFELLADPTISQTNQGWPYPYFYIGWHQVPQAPGTIWANEVCDPVEAYAYQLHGVAISDWITPNWFNDRVNGGYDYMNVVQNPFQVTHGGYAQFWTGFGWQAVINFKHAGPDANGYLKAEKSVRPQS